MRVEFVSKKVIGLGALGVLGGVLSAALELVFAYALLAFLAAFGILPALPEGHRLASWMEHREWLLGLLVALGVGRGLLTWAQAYLNLIFFSEFILLQRSRILSWIMRGHSMDTARALSVFGEYAAQAATVLTNWQVVAYQGIIVLILLPQLFWIAPRTTVVLLAVIGFAGLVLKAVARAAGAGRGTFYSDWDDVYKRFVLATKNLLLIRIHGMQKSEEQLARRSLAAYYEGLGRSYRWTTFRGAMPQMVGVAGVCAIVPFLGALDGTPTSLVLGYVYLFFRVVQNLGGINQAYSTVRDHSSALNTVYEWWQGAQAADRDRDQRITPMRVTRSNGSAPFSHPMGWSLKGVRFAYPGTSQVILDRFDAEFRENSISVILGESGRGKSTLLELLIGGLTPQQGHVEVRSGDLRAQVGAPKVQGDEQFLKSIGYVGPENFIFDGTFYENLTYGLSFEPTREQIDEALRLAECDFIHKTSTGLQHRLTDQGQGLSAGQKQRMSIARALLRQPRALIIDEGTSNLDRSTEERILKNLVALKDKMTIVIVTHRESFKSIADQVIEL